MGRDGRGLERPSKRPQNDPWNDPTLRHIHPGGPKTVLMKTQFLKKTCVSPQRGNNLYPWKSVKFGRPNLSLFLGNCVFTSVKHHFVIHFDRASITLLSFHFICRNISTVFSSSFLYLFTKRHCHILAYNITSLCLAPKEFGMIFLQLVHAASIVPVWHLMVERPRLTSLTNSPRLCRTYSCSKLCLRANGG